MKLRPADRTPVESVCPTSEGQYTWTRKSADVPVHCDVRVNEKRWRADARGVIDDSAGYHPHHTVWSWSAGIGRSDDGRAVGWNLVSGINDPPHRSERAIWIDGDPFEPGPVEFDDLDAVAFDDGSRLSFDAECERARREPAVHPLLLPPADGDLHRLASRRDQLAHGLGVMEHHDAVW